MNRHRHTNLARLPTYTSFLAVALLLASAIWVAKGSFGTARVDFILPDVRGGLFHLQSQRAGPVLLAFLQTVPDTADTPSRSQAVFLSSMAQQYGRHGLTVVVIDASTLVNFQRPDHAALVNAGFDWQMNFPFLEDARSQIARRFRVKEIPTTILLAPDGVVSQRWQGLTGPAILAKGIEKFVHARTIAH